MYKDVHPRLRPMFCLTTPTGNTYTEPALSRRIDIHSHTKRPGLHVKIRLFFVSAFHLLPK